MRHITAFLTSTLIAFAASLLMLFVGWRLDTLDLFAGIALGLALGFVGAAAFLPRGRDRSRRPVPARYALAGGFMGLANFTAAGAAVLVQPWLQEDGASPVWMTTLMTLTGGWMLAKAAADPGRILVVAVASAVSGLIAGWVYGATLRRRAPPATSRA